jgi:ABC-type branched-subunit amino acid transport system substrate-binding protein
MTVVIPRGRISRRLVAAATGLALMASACQTPAASPSATPIVAPTASSGSTPAPAAVQGVSDDGVITVGAWIAQSGPLAVAANYAYGAQAYFDTINDAGGVNGHTFSFTVIDDGADPTKTVTAAKQLWEEDKVFAFFLPYGSSPFSAVQQYVADNQIPVFCPTANPDLYFPKGQPPAANIFGYLPPYSSLVSQLVTWANENLGVTKLAVVHTNDAFGQSGLDAANALAASLGIEIVDDIGYDSTETNYAPFGRRVADSGADATLVWAIPGSAQVMTAAIDSGYDSKWLINEAFRGGFFLEQIRGLAGVTGNTYLNLYQQQSFSHDPTLDEFKSVFPTKYPDGDPLFALAGWTCAAMFVEGVRESTADGAQLTWPTLASTLESWQSVNIAAAVGITYSAEQHIGALRAQVMRLDGDGYHAVTDFVVMPELAQYAGQ